MEILEHLGMGFVVALTGYNLLYCVLGVALGTAVGVLPGLGPVATISMLLPLTFGLEPVSALIMLSGIYYGAQYGSSTTAILINLPGEASSVVTALDGHQLARQGRGGEALAVAAAGSFVAGTFATFLIALFAPPLSELALKFGAPEYLSLMVLGLVASVVLAQGALLHAFAMIIIGLILGLVGIDINSGVPRYTFGLLNLYDGINMVVVAMGTFGLAEIILNLEEGGRSVVVRKRIGGLLPSWHVWRKVVAPIFRGTAFGSLLGILPGGGAMLASFAAYALEKKISRDPKSFGHGAIEGVAAPESANNAGAQTSFIPMLTLGIPSNPVMALMIGALILHGIQPGPAVIREQPTLFWGVIISMWIGNIILLILNLPLVGFWARMIAVPYRLLYPIIMVFCAIGVFSISNNVFNIYLMAMFGAVGYVLRKLGGELAPMLLGFILGPLMEEYLRRALLISNGDPTIFVHRPVSAVLLLAAVLLLGVVLAPAIRAGRKNIFEEER